MPLLRKGALIPVKGIDFSKPSTFIDIRNGFPQNMRFWRNIMRKRPGSSAFGSQISNATPIMGLGKLEDNNELKFLVRASKIGLERYNTATSAWVSIAATAFGGGDEDFFHFATVSESGLLIITNWADPIRKWSGSGNNSVLGGSPGRAKYCTYLTPYLLLAYLDEGAGISPWKTKWCDTDAPETWAGGNSGSSLLSREPSPIQNIMKLNEFAAVYKKDSLWLGRKVETSDIFIFDQIKTGIGLSSPRSLAEADGKHYFMGANDFYVWNGIREESIGGPVRDEVFAKINRAKIKRCHALHIKELSEIWFYIVITGATWPTEIWKYNYRTGFWYYDTVLNITAAIKWEKTSTEAWDDDTGTWDSAEDAWDSGVSVQDWEEVIFGDSDGNNYKLDYTTTDDAGNAVAAQFVTKDFTGDQLEFTKRWLRLDVWARGPGDLLVDYSTDLGNNWINIPFSPTAAAATLTSLYVKREFYFDVWAEHIRFRFRNAVTGETFYLKNFYPYYLAEEEVRTHRS